MASMTLSFDPTDAGEVLTVSQIVELIRDVNEFEQANAHDELVAAVAEVGNGAWASKAVDALWARLGSKLRVFMVAAAELTREHGEYTVPELADRLGERDRVVVSWRANLGRSLKAVAKEFPQAPPFFADRLDEGTNTYRYSMTSDIADAVLSHREEDR